MTLREEERYGVVIYLEEIPGDLGLEIALVHRKEKLCVNGVSGRPYYELHNPML